MKKALLIGALSATTLLSTPLLAEEASSFKTNRVEVSYNVVDEASGPGVYGLARLSDKWFVGAGYSNYGFDDFDADTTFSEVMVGYGTDTKTKNGVVFFGLGAGKADISVCAFSTCGSADVNYYKLSYNHIEDFTEKTEMTFRVTATFYDEDIDNEYGISLGYGYKLTDNFVIGATGAINDEGDWGYSADVVYRF